MSAVLELARPGHLTVYHWVTPFSRSMEHLYLHSLTLMLIDVYLIPPSPQLARVRRSGLPKIGAAPSSVSCWGGRPRLRQ